MGESYFLAMWCPTCNKKRYQTIKAFEKDSGEIPLATDFKPVDDAPEISDPGQLPLCHECNSIMQPKLLQAAIPEETLEAPKRNNVKPFPIRGNTNSVQTLFQVDADEQIANIRDLKDGLLLITTKRIIKVPL